MRIAQLATLVALSILAACNGPSPALIGTPAQEITVDGARFRVFVQGERAEAVRLNFEFPANVRTVFPRAITAIKTVSGCDVDPAAVTGDAALIKARLDCS